MYGRLPSCVAVFSSCPVRPSVCATDFHSHPARPSVCVAVFYPARYMQWSPVLHSAAAGVCGRLPDLHGGLQFCPVRSTWWSSLLPSTAISVRDQLPWCHARCCGFVIGGPRSLVRLSDNPVVIGTSNPRSRHSSCHSDMSEGRSRYVDNILRGEESPD